MRVLQSKKVLTYLIFLSVLLIVLYNLIKTITIPMHIIHGYDNINHRNMVVTENEALKGMENITLKIKEDKKTQMKYILQWTSAKSVPFVYMGEGQNGFIDRNCQYVNCFVTANRSYLDDYTKFDVIAFNGPEVLRLSNNMLPDKRSPHQKYVFATIESSDYYPICSSRFDGVFNWTWTFRLDSEVRWGYMVIKDKNQKVIGPKKLMHWLKLEDMDPVSNEFKEKLKSKKIAAAWFVSNCHSRSNREGFVHELQEELKKYEHTVDVYGQCGPLKCSRDNEAECDRMIKEKYYFYLSFENSFSEDYVTEKLLHALENDAVPIVFGDANYTRFMPDGIYLNARELGVKNLAAKMDELIKAPEKYIELFRWKNHYSYHRQSESVDTDEYCQFCTILNDEELVKKTQVYTNFRQWWDSPSRC